MAVCYSYYWTRFNKYRMGIRHRLTVLKTGNISRKQTFPSSDTFQDVIPSQTRWSFKLALSALLISSLYASSSTNDCSHWLKRYSVFSMCRRLDILWCRSHQESLRKNFIGWRGNLESKKVKKTKSQPEWSSWLEDKWGLAIHFERLSLKRGRSVSWTVTSLQNFLFNPHSVFTKASVIPPQPSLNVVRGWKLSVKYGNTERD